MNKFSYSLELYKRNIFSLKELKEYQDSIKLADEVENYFINYNSNIDLIRNNIITSYVFKPVMNLDDRINYVKGIIYSKQFMNEEDLYKLEEIFNNLMPGDEILELSLFSVRSFSDEFDYDYYYNYLRNTRYDEKYNEIRDEHFIKTLIEKSKERFNKDMEEEQHEENNVIVDEETDENEEDDFDIERDAYKMEDLSIRDRIKFSKEYFPIYVDGIINNKGIKEGTKEYEYLSKGMFDYFSYIIYQYEETFNFFYKEFLRNSKNLTLNL